MTAVPNEWLCRKGTPEEFERAELQRKASAFNLQFEAVAQKFGARPFGQMTDHWRAFVAKLEMADELWQFSSPAEMFAKKMGCAGYAIVRDGTIRDTFITTMT